MGLGRVPGTPADWIAADGAFTVRPGSGKVQARQLFGDCQLHLQWRLPATVTGSDQARGNRGLFLASTGIDSGYEIQILDCANNSTCANGQAASIYQPHIPLVNAYTTAGQWQTCDVIWTAPRFAADGSPVSPACATALQQRCPRAEPCHPSGGIGVCGQAVIPSTRARPDQAAGPRRSCQLPEYPVRPLAASSLPAR